MKIIFFINNIISIKLCIFARKVVRCIKIILFIELFNIK